MVVLHPVSGNSLLDTRSRRWLNHHQQRRDQVRPGNPGMKEAVVGGIGASFGSSS
jgi:hypothetical protein